jgi:hypothetical protein
MRLLRLRLHPSGPKTRARCGCFREGGRAEVSVSADWLDVGLPLAPTPKAKGLGLEGLFSAPSRPISNPVRRDAAKPLAFPSCRGRAGRSPRFALAQAKALVASRAPTKVPVWRNLEPQNCTGSRPALQEESGLVWRGIPFKPCGLGWFRVTRRPLGRTLNRRGQRAPGSASNYHS